MVLLVVAVVAVCCSAADATDVNAQSAKIKAQAAKIKAQAAEIKAQAAKIKALEAENKAQAAENKAPAAVNKTPVAKIAASQEAQTITAPASQVGLDCKESSAGAALAWKACPVALLEEKVESRKGGYGYGGYGSKAKPSSAPQKVSEKDSGALARCHSSAAIID